MMKYSNIVECAKSFTEIALQNKMITVGSDNNETAKNIADFFNTIANNLSIEEE